MQQRTHWQDNLRLVRRCLAVWFLVSFGFGILLLDVLNHIQIGVVRLGFWFAQQGSILVFVVLILVYALLLNKLDAQHHEELVQLRRDVAGDDSTTAER